MSVNWTKTPKIVLIAMFWIGFAGLLWAYAIWNSYLDVLPRHPEPAAGNVYPLNIHGIIAYQTEEQRRHRETVQDCSMAIGFTSFFLIVLYKNRIERHR
jgi:hypothetical protein